jgi:hypothetical protein
VRRFPCPMADTLWVQPFARRRVTQIKRILREPKACTPQSKHFGVGFL